MTYHGLPDDDFVRALGLPSLYAEQLAGIAPPVMHEAPNPERLRDATPATKVFPNHEGSEL